MAQRCFFTLQSWLKINPVWRQFLSLYLGYLPWGMRWAGKCRFLVTLMEMSLNYLDHKLFYGGT